MKKKIYLVDLTHESKLGIGSDTMPLQLGLIGAYCLQEIGDQVEVQLFKYTKDFEEAVLKEPPFIVAASNYIWNINLTSKFVAALKRLSPKTISVFGGPNYPDERDEQVDWLVQRPEIDFYINKDGEIPFARLVRQLLTEPNIEVVQRMELPSVHAVLGGKAYFGETEKRMRDLTSIPSPYTTGLMDKFFEQRLLPTIQTNRGCPFTCTFCTEGGKYYNKVYKSSLDRKIEEVTYIVERVTHTKSLRITDSNFGMFEEDVEFCRFLGGIQEKTGYPEYVMCSTGKNRKERVLECNALLNGAMRLTASVQSLDQNVLEAVKRKNISLENLMYVSDETSDTETHAYSEVILGLPGDSVASMTNSFKGLMESGIGNITQHQLALIYGTELNSEETRTRYGLNSQFRPIQRCVGKYSLGEDQFAAVEIEEICVSSDTLSFEDYIEMRRLYLTIGLFYNDRIFGEIHALLRLLNESTFSWLQLIHENIGTLPSVIQEMYEGFTKDTKDELWVSEEQLITDVVRDVDRYDAGECGGNLIYKYRSKSIVENFDVVLETAYKYLRIYLKSRDFSDLEIVSDIERFARHQKLNLLETDLVAEDNFEFDVQRLIHDPLYARQGGSIEGLRRSARLAFQHSEKQRTTIHREVEFYGRDIPGLTMMISRYPVKRF